MARWGRPAAVAGWEERTAARRRRERDDAPVELQRLVGELRPCKDRCELSLTSLAAKTGFSVSSWQRYLGGRSLPRRPLAASLGSRRRAGPAGASGTWQVTGGLGSGCRRLGGYRPTP
ncbi:helix-turn-helix domain-containing protein [Streptomyces sp. NBC_00271]|uniref:helix-turn-helix domain-containing protein n=1 Tax=Streptomyces sp. NBC_00271 TaxID=2975697 RepID=UPI002E2DDA1F|nr:helix-turn-helix domain-containing protein [Streptomyces sp. NBC_00271]